MRMGEPPVAREGARLLERRLTEVGCGARVGASSGLTGSLILNVAAQFASRCSRWPCGVHCGAPTHESGTVKRQRGGRLQDPCRAMRSAGCAFGGSSFSGRSTGWLAGTKRPMETCLRRLGSWVERAIRLSLRVGHSGSRCATSCRATPAPVQGCGEQSV